MKGEGNQLDFGARIYDPRIGRFLSVDPLTGYFADQSPYGFAANSPLLFVDAMGLSPELGDPPTKTRAKTYIRVRTYREVPNPSGNNIRNTPRVSRWSGVFKTVSTLGGATSIWNWISKPANADYAGPGAADGNELSFKDIEIFTDNPSILQDGYLGLVKSRILDGTAKASDWRYTEELHKRGLLSRSESEGKLASTPLPSDLPEFVYRFDTRSPEEIKAAGGFEVWGSNTSLSDHTNGSSLRNKTSAFLGTSSSTSALQEWIDGYGEGWIYRIKTPASGVNINLKYSSDDYVLSWEQEIAIPNRIPWGNIVDWTHVKSEGP